MSDLPKGWKQAAFVDLLAPLQDGRIIHQGWSPRCESEPSKTVEDWGVLKTTAIQDGYFLDQHNKKLPPTLSPRPLLEVHEGDLVMTCAGPRARCGIATLVRKTRPRLMLSGKMYRMRASQYVQPGYLEAALRSSEAQDAIDAMKTGMSESGMNLTHERFATLKVNVAPAAEQRRIVEKLDALTARTTRARADLDRIPALAARYKQAVLAKAFSGELTPHISASEFSLANLAEVLVSTFYGPRFNKGAYCDQGIPTLRTTDFDAFGRVAPKDPPRVNVSTKELEKWGLRDGDLLITRTGSIGKCAVYESSMGPALPSAYLIRTRLKLDQIEPRFALLFLLSARGQEQLGLGITAVAQPNINAGVIERLQLPVPSLATQSEIVSKVDAMFADIDRMATEAAASRRLLDRLDQAILAKAFRGELVPQDPSDEPANVLLERIRAERANAPKATRARRKANAA